jgi:adenine-specific DNA-methyltransferase
MSFQKGQNRARQILERFMLPVIRDLLQTEPNGDADSLYRQAVELAVHTLLLPFQQGNVPEPSCNTVCLSSLSAMAQEIGPLTPADVGEIYEYLRGFRLDMKSRSRWKIVPSAASKRNQGLFYTPKVIVSYIVHQTLDALDLREQSHYLDVKILDPAVGTGLFLSEALDQIAGRVLAAMQHGDKALTRRVDDIGSRIREKIGNHWSGQELEKEAAVRIHILSECLYGVDLDPVAVNIARKTLLARVFGQRPIMPEFAPNVRVGNALMGEGTVEPRQSSKEDRDRRLAAVYFWKQPVDDHKICAWSKEKRIFHWPIEFPEVFDRDGGGLDAVIGNPPYEILSVKESGIRERNQEQAYVRRMFRTCKGKINTYRLMLERGLTLLRKGGVLGFVVPATLLADSTADKLRRMILNETIVLKTVIVPEKARAFKGVAQAVLILVTRKSGRTGKIEPIFWKGKGSIPARSRTEISRELIEQANFRIPVIKEPEDVALLEALLRHPPLGGNKDFPPAGRVHQGEINLTVHREFITAQRTSYPLIRGEHIMPLRLDHPSPVGNRLDWVLPKFFDWYTNRKGSSQSEQRATQESSSRRLRVTPWEQDRIAIGRVVNMDSYRRLKAVGVPAGAFLGDMTNFIADLTVPIRYLLGLLNSRILNRRFKLTSTNNYLSAAEIEALPIPRIAHTVAPGIISESAITQFRSLVADQADSISGWLERIAASSERSSTHEDAVSIPEMIELVVQAIQAEPSSVSAGRGQRGPLWLLLDALVLKLYGVEAYAGFL